MKIGMIGAGHIGSNAARLFVKAGHEVKISNSRGPETLESLVQELDRDLLSVLGQHASSHDRRSKGVCAQDASTISPPLYCACVPRITRFNFFLFLATFG